MILLIRHEGQLCNRIWGFLPVLSHSLHTGQKIVLMSCRKQYLDYFPNLKESKNLNFIHSIRGLNPGKSGIRFIKILHKVFGKYEGSLENIPQHGTSIVNGWDYRNDLAFIDEHKSEIRRLFEPTLDVRNKVDAYWNGYKGTTIGVHIRRGDYKTHMGGAYYFDDSVYQNAMQSISAQLKENGTDNVRFLICTNGETYFSKSVSTFSIDNASAIDDLYALSKCDFIIGPPSSFSQWASFYGEKPLYFLLNRSCPLNIQDASPIVALDRFANGKVLKIDEQKNEYVIG